jgi:gas vesicle protein
MSNNGSSAGTIVMAFAIGALAGATVALLYAPAAGDETRRKLAQRAREARDRAEEFAREGREFINRQRDNVATAVERGREVFEQTRKESL